ncbi:DUF4342 domain-containing protein [Rubrivirga sp. S365]|uniref:DUF4342 domain-containing protein n=1 Tax=Rubrivirga litoralis TaxID=3075598 RepID=A0ABU3BV44_9BACT|nr:MULTISPECIES: DUF4342 domain-containing protein [unclassified Rubrivirga]MDT0633167.1 DUF4342 domain-containing protein [Rubrivirga sp. F394]MDT7857774.1 DUF4342 domain-containing protein [Rubrivirga sp. S365]
MPAPPNDDKTLETEATRLADTARDKAEEAFEEVKLASNELVDTVRSYIEDANVKHVKIQKEGRTLLEIPMTVGVGAGAAALLFNPVLSAVGALAALVSDVTIVVERTTDAGGASGEAVENVNHPSGSATGSAASGTSAASSGTTSSSDKTASPGKPGASGKPSASGGSKTVGRSSDDA